MIEDRDKISFFQRVDSSTFNYIKRKLSSPRMDKLMIFFTRLGDIGIVWAVIALILFIQDEYKLHGAMVFGSIIITTVIGEGILKHIIKRNRPCTVIKECSLLIKKPLSYSFPSGHTASSFAAAGVLFNNMSIKFGVIFFALAALIAFSRIYLYVHYVTDIVGGIVLGLLCSQVTISIFNRIIIL